MPQRLSRHAGSFAAQRGLLMDRELANRRGELEAGAANLMTGNAREAGAEPAGKKKAK